jgi:hypothetical protein
VAACSKRRRFSERGRNPRAGTRVINAAKSHVPDAARVMFSGVDHGDTARQDAVAALLAYAG